jgi:hypothetical protein
MATRRTMAPRRAKPSLKIETLRIVHEHDEESKPEDKVTGESENEREDKAYIDSYYNDEWTFLGVYVEADLLVAGTVQTIRSAGLWGIESNSGNEYLDGVAEEEYDELLGILEALGVAEDAVPPLEDAEEEER